MVKKGLELAPENHVLKRLAMYDNLELKDYKEGAIVKNCVINADVVIGKGVHVENLVIDKHARLIRGKRVIAAPEKPGYIKRGDRL